MCFHTQLANSFIVSLPASYLCHQGLWGPCLFVIYLIYHQLIMRLWHSSSAVIFIRGMCDLANTSFEVSIDFFWSDCWLCMWYVIIKYCISSGHYLPCQIYCLVLTWCGPSDNKDISNVYHFRTILIWLDSPFTKHCPKILFQFVYFSY